MRFSKNLSLIALVSIACSALAAQSGQARVFQGFYDQYNGLILKKDVAGLKSLVTTSHTDDFLEIGKANKAGKVKKSTELTFAVMVGYSQLWILHRRVDAHR